MSNDELNQKAKRDCQSIVGFMESHPQFHDMYRAFIKGPKPDCGFMWTPDNWWVGEEKSAIKIVSDKVLDHGWDSSGYGIMMRMIQRKIKEMPVATAVTLLTPADLQDDEGKCSGDVCTGKGSLLENCFQTLAEKPKEVNDDGRSMAQMFLQTGFAKTMDDNNKEALKVAAEKGMDEAAKHMMDQAGGDYGRMRSMFG